MTKLTDGSTAPNVLTTEIGRLPDGYKDKALEHIKRKSVQRNDACLVCGSEDSSVHAYEFGLDILNPPGTSPTGDSMPLVVATCTGCGFVRMFNRFYVSILIDQHEAEGAANGASAHGK